MMVPARITIVVTVLALAAGCAVETERTQPSEPAAKITLVEQVPVKHRTGYARFQQICAACHGVWANGSQNGPPLVHDLYKPGHHSNRAFTRAILGGTKQHHWYFGDMPPVAGATQNDVQKIVPYLRWLQKAEDKYY